MKKIFKGNGETFSAKSEAETWLRDNGYCVGSSCVSGPQGVVKGEDIYISKWHNMTKKEQNSLDGSLQAGREGDAVLTLRSSMEVVK